MASCMSDEGNAVQCVRNEDGDYHISFLPCYCITQYDNSSTAVVGLCLYTCTENLPVLNAISLPLSIDVWELSHVVCNNFSRTGQMCGECDCSQYKRTVCGGSIWATDTFIVTGRISVTSGLMVGYVTASQVVATGVELRFKASKFHSKYYS